MEQKILSLKDDKINSEVELIEYPVELIGGRNLLFNTGFNNGTEYWTSQRGTEIEAINNELKATNNPNSDWPRIFKRMDTPIIKGQEYVLTFEYKGSSEGNSTMGISAPNSTNPILNSHTLDWSDSEWKKFSVAFKALNSSNTSSVLWIYVNDHQSSTVNTRFIRRVKLEKGNKATDWTPAPEDLGLTYPDFITEFKPSISDRYILTEELIEYPEELIGGRNLVAISKIKTGYNISSSNGEIQETTRAQVIEDFFEVSSNKNISVSRKRETTNNFGGTALDYLRLAFYNQDKEFIGTYEGNAKEPPVATTIPDGSYYFRMSSSRFDLENLKIELGSTPTPWTPAPEDLGLSYPDHIQSFGTSFGNNILINEFIEQ